MKDLAGFTVLFEDNHLLIAYKPCQVTTEGEKEDTLENLLARAIALRDHKVGERAFVKAVHRLDRPASGIVALAKSSKALSRLHKQLRERVWKKHYLAKLEREPSDKQGTLIHYLERGDHKTKIVCKGEGKEAKLEYKVIAPKVVDIVLHTGRYHQIRAQFAAIGCPIQGDYKYGAKERERSQGIDLCHYRLELMHPVTNESLCFEIEPAFV